jgi:predicted phosphodiesterase
MPSFVQHNRLLYIHGRGPLWVCSDLHGNLRDFRHVVQLFREEKDAALLFLGDLVHGPSEEAQAKWHPGWGCWYEDESAQLLREFWELQREFPRRVTTLLGNHEHAHHGGPVLSKFHPDEGAFLEEQLSKEEQKTLRQWVAELPWIGLTEGGVVFVHGSPSHSPFDKESIGAMALGDYSHLQPSEMKHSGFLGELLWKRSATYGDTFQFLRRLQESYGFPHASIVVHGHEIVMDGVRAVHSRLVTLSSSFGMRDTHKMLLRLDVPRVIRSVEELQRGIEWLMMYPELTLREFDRR